MRSLCQLLALCIVLALAQAATSQESPSTEADPEIPVQIGNSSAPAPLAPDQKIALMQLQLETTRLEKRMAEANGEWTALQRRGEQLQAQYQTDKAKVVALEKTFHGKLVAIQGGTGYTVSDSFDWVPCPPPGPNPLQPGCPDFDKSTAEPAAP